MARKKKKNRKSNVFSEENLSARRSSLQVNLSFVSSLSDSGNGSLHTSQPENKELAERERSQSDFCGNALSNIVEDTSSIACVEDAAVSAINEKEQSLNQSCQLLKAAILNKTRELFDRKTELALKTKTVLKGQRQALKEINDYSKLVHEKTVLSKSSSIHNPISKNRLQTPSIESSSKNNLPSLARISNSDKSFILSGSNKSYRNIASPNLKNQVLRVRLTRIADPRLRTSSESSQSSSIADDIGIPLTCSSFISDCVNRVGSASQQAESDGRKSIENSDVEEPVDRSKSSSRALTPMEITAVQGPIPSTSRRNFTGLRPPGNVTMRPRQSTNLNYPEDVPMELTTVQSNIIFRDSAVSNKTTRTSLNVNTSADELSYRPEKQNSEGASTIPENDNTRVDRTAHISLRVNTSLGTEESPAQETANNDDSKAEGSVINDTDEEVIDRSRRGDINSTENISLIARLRNLSAKTPTEPADSSKIDRFNRSSFGEGPSFIEGTPFPPSRSLLWKTQIRLGNAIRNRTARKSRPVTPDSDSYSPMGTEYSTPSNNTIALDQSPSRHICDTSKPQIIEDSSEEDQPVQTACTNVTVPKENAAPNIQRPGKKKLLSLQQDHELVSLSPLSPGVPSTKKTITWKPRRKLQKRKAVRAIAAKRIEAVLERGEEEEDVPASSFIDRNNIQKEKTKAKLPRKVISKKIVVKKIAGLDILEQLGGMGRTASDHESTASERSSINEFTKKRRISMVGRILKAERLVIVATGFAKGDVDLVKRVAKDLGGAEINATVSRRTTHVVSTGVRTINLLRGIIRGCWLVSLDWVLKSLEHEKWLSAEQYEMIHFSKAVQENRRDRQLFGKAYVPELFTTCGLIYIEHGSTPPPEILKELVKTAGGRITEDPRNAKLSVGPEGLREIWILDSITTGDLQPIEDYGRK